MICLSSTMSSLDAADKQRPSSVSRFISGEAAARVSAASILVPKFGDPIDLHIGLRDVRARARADDVRLDVAATPGTA